MKENLNGKEIVIDGVAYTLVAKAQTEPKKTKVVLTIETPFGNAVIGGNICDLREGITEGEKNLYGAKVTIKFYTEDEYKKVAEKYKSTDNLENSIPNPIADIVMKTIVNGI